jgi:hypothetical protein
MEQLYLFPDLAPAPKPSKVKVVEAPGVEPEESNHSKSHD